MGNAYSKSVRIDITLNGFKSIGMWPYKRHEFYDDDFYATTLVYTPPLDINNQEKFSAVHKTIKKPMRKRCAFKLNKTAFKYFSSYLNNKPKQRVPWMH